MVELITGGLRVDTGGKSNSPYELGGVDDTPRSKQG